MNVSRAPCVFARCSRFRALFSSVVNRTTISIDDLKTYEMREHIRVPIWQTVRPMIHSHPIKGGGGGRGASFENCFVLPKPEFICYQFRGELITGHMGCLWSECSNYNRVRSLLFCHYL